MSASWFQGSATIVRRRDHYNASLLIAVVLCMLLPGSGIASPDWGQLTLQDWIARETAPSELEFRGTQVLQCRKIQFNNSMFVHRDKTAPHDLIVLADEIEIVGDVVFDLSRTLSRVPKGRMPQKDGGSAILICSRLRLAQGASLQFLSQGSTWVFSGSGGNLHIHATEIVRERKESTSTDAVQERDAGGSAGRPAQNDQGGGGRGADAGPIEWNSDVTWGKKQVGWVSSTDSNWPMRVAALQKLPLTYNRSLQAGLPGPNMVGDFPRIYQTDLEGNFVKAADKRFYGVREGRRLTRELNQQECALSFYSATGMQGYVREEGWRWPAGKSRAKVQRDRPDSTRYKIELEMENEKFTGNPGQLVCEFGPDAGQSVLAEVPEGMLSTWQVLRLRTIANELRAVLVSPDPQRIRALADERDRLLSLSIQVAASDDSDYKRLLSEIETSLDAAGDAVEELPLELRMPDGRLVRVVAYRSFGEKAFRVLPDICTFAAQTREAEHWVGEVIARPEEGVLLFSLQGMLGLDLLTEQSIRSKLDEMGHQFGGIVDNWVLTPRPLEMPGIVADQTQVQLAGSQINVILALTASDDAWIPLSQLSGQRGLILRILYAHPANEQVSGEFTVPLTLQRQNLLDAELSTETLYVTNRGLSSIQIEVITSCGRRVPVNPPVFIAPGDSASLENMAGGSSQCPMELIPDGVRHVVRTDAMEWFRFMPSGGLLRRFTVTSAIPSVSRRFPDDLPDSQGRKFMFLQLSVTETACESHEVLAQKDVRLRSAWPLSEAELIFIGKPGLQTCYEVSGTAHYSDGSALPLKPMQTTGRQLVVSEDDLWD